MKFSLLVYRRRAWSFNRVTSHITSLKQGISKLHLTRRSQNVGSITRFNVSLLHYNCLIGPIWVFHDRRFCQNIWQIFTQGRAKKNCQKLPPVGIETRTSGSLGQCLTNWARQESVGQEISEVSFVCFMHQFTCWTLFICRAWSIEHDFIKAMKIQAANWMLT